MEIVRLGYVGCGLMAQKVHIPNFASTAGCGLVAVAEVRRDIREKVADRYGIPRRYASAREMAEAGDLDAVAVSADYSLQGEVAMEFLKRGLPVFMEKPMATTVAQARRILEAARQGGGRLMVAYMKRYDAGNHLARDAIRAARQSGELGRARFVRAHGFCGDWTAGLDMPFEKSAEPNPPSPMAAPDWLPEKWHKPYVSYLQQYTHNINLVRWLLDAGDNVRVRAVDLDDDGMTGLAVLEVAGVRAVIESGGMNYHAWDEHTQVYFEHGWVRTSSPPLLLKNVPAEVDIYRARPTRQFLRPVPQPAWMWAYKREAEEFIRCVRTGDPFDASGEDTLTDVRLYEEIYRTWLKGRGEV